MKDQRNGYLCATMSEPGALSTPRLWSIPRKGINMTERTCSIGADIRTDAIQWLAKHQRPLANGCIEWTAGRDQDGYGIISRWNPATYKTTTYRAHRLAWELRNDRLLFPGEVVRHSCDHPPCVNPDHLLIGSHKDNSADRDTRGRTARGPTSGRSRFSINDVQTIRAELAAGTSALALSRRFGCSLSAIQHIRYRRVWAWL